MAGARTFAVAVLALLCTGCIHHLGGAKLPIRGWDKAPADCAMLRDPQPTRPTMRILACHSFWYGDHAAIWVGSPSGIWAFWDPAGWLADDMNWKDKDDVICRPFDLQSYWRWRTGDYDGLDMLVFEWDVSEQEVRRIHRLLTSGCYPTSTLPGLCCFNVVNFITNFIPGVCAPPPPFSISPGLLGEQLWSQNPDRVIVFHKDCPTRIWRPQDRSEPPGLMTPRRVAPEPVASSRAVVVQPTAAARAGTYDTHLPVPGTLLRMDEIRPTHSR